MDSEQTTATAYDEDYGMNLFFHKGLPYGPGQNAEKCEVTSRFPFDPSDVLIAAFPKSGSTWVQVMLANLWDDWGTIALSENRKVPQLEYDPGPPFEGTTTCLRARPPRLMRTHLPIGHMPETWRDVGCKVIYIARNPKSVCVSFFHQLNTPDLGFRNDWDSWVTKFVEGKTMYGPWLDHVLGWISAKQENILYVTYEETLADPTGILRRIVDFLGRKVSDERFDQVIADTRFDRMRKNAYGRQIQGGPADTFLRAGTVDSWKKTFSVAQSELFDRVLDARLRERGVRLEYE